MRPIDQEIIVNNVFHLWGWDTPTELLQVLSLVCSLNLLFIEKILITRDHTKKIGISGISIVSFNINSAQILKAFMTFHDNQKLSSPRRTFTDF